MNPPKAPAWLSPVVRGAQWLIVAALVSWSVQIALTALFVRFHTYDDEGYVLLTLVNYLKHGALYDVVYTQYGPFFYQLYGGLSRLFDFDFTNATGRYLTAINWIAISIVCASIAQRLTRRWLWWPVCFAASFIHIRTVTWEPMHPVSLTCLLWVGATWLLISIDSRKHPLLPVIGVGLIVAALTFIKINMGVFLFAATAVWLVVRSGPQDTSSRLQVDGFRLVRVLCLATTVFFPFALMGKLVDEPAFLMFASMFAANAAILLFVLRANLVQTARRSETLSFLAAFGVTSAGVVALALSNGTSAMGLVRGVLLDPLQHPTVIFFALPWNPVSVLFVAVVAIISAVRLWRPTWLPDTWFGPSRAVVVAALSCGFLSFGLRTEELPIPADGFPFHSLLLPFAWISASQILTSSRLAWVKSPLAFLVLAVPFGYLQSFPIPGSQFTLGSVLVLPLACVALDDSVISMIQTLTKEGRIWSTRVRRVSLLALSIIVPAPFVFTMAAFAGWQDGQLETMSPFGLPGTDGIVQSETETAARQILTENAAAFGDMLFTLPGMYSFNLWARLPTPTLTNLTSWWQGLSKEKQEEIRMVLDADPLPVVIVNRRLWNFLKDKPYRPSGPLVEHITNDFPIVFGAFGFEFRVKEGRQIDPFWVVRLDRGSLKGSGVTTAKMKVRIPPRPGMVLSRVELRQIGFPQSMATLVVGEHVPNWSYEFTRDDGRQVAHDEVQLDEPTWLGWELPDPASTIQPFSHMLWFFDEDDQCIGRAVLNLRL